MGLCRSYGKTPRSIVIVLGINAIGTKSKRWMTKEPSFPFRNNGSFRGFFAVTQNLNFQYSIKKKFDRFS